MKWSSAVAAVLPSLVMLSCVSEEGPSASYARGVGGNLPEESRAAVQYLVEAHHDYLARASTGALRPPVRAECN